MGWIHRVWDGPFKTPQQQPITVGWALLKLFETLWRFLLVVLLMIALLAIYVWQSERNPLSSQVGVELSDSTTNTMLCKSGYPIFATIRNDSGKNIGEVSLRFRVYPHGKSDDVALGSYNDLHDILRPHQSLQYCFPMPELKAGAAGPFTLSAEVTYAAELSKDVPVPPEPPSIMTISAPPPLVQVNAAALHPPAPPQTLWTKIMGAIVVLVCLLLFASGGFALMLLCDRLLRTRMVDKMRGGARVYVMLLIFGFLNTCLVDAGSYGLTAYGWDGWLTGIDNWSWANGFTDGGVMFIGAVFCQWPWVVLFAVRGPRGSTVHTA
jgi:hypothetical protein